MRLFLSFALLFISVSGVAQTGNADEDYETASSYYEQGDYKNALRYLMSAANAGNSNAQNDIGNMYSNGDGVVKSYAKAYEWYMKAANQGHCYAQNHLGDLFYYGNGIRQDYMKAFEWYSKAAERGYDVAQYNLGILYDNGYGVRQDYMKAFEWYSKAVENGNIDAQFRLGHLYENGNGVKQDYMKAYEWYMKAAENNCDIAQARIGYLYDNGYGVKQDYVKAFEWYSKAANQELDAAMYELGTLYSNGYGVKQDYMKAFEWYSKAAKQDFAPAMYGLGTLYLDGNGINQNYMKAFEWYSKAAELGDADAMHNLGYLYYKGLGVNRDYNKSEQYFKNALENIDDCSGTYSFLAAIYALRDKDFKKATEYVNLALSSTKEDDTERLARLYGRCGYVYYLQGDMANAGKMWKKCIEFNPNYPTIDAEFPKVMANYNINEIDTKIIQNPSNNTNTFAIVIGNEKYKNEVDVPFANNDSKIFSQYVEKTLGVPHNQIRLIENAGYNDIRIAVSWLVQAMQVCRGKGKAIIYYAGHGIPNESDLSSYLLPVDGIGNDPGSAYSLKDLYDKLGSIEVQSITIFLDACFSGSKREDGMLASARGVALKAKQSAPKGNMIVFTAAQGDETAYPYKDKQHGMFTFFLLKKLQETKGDVTLGELSEYLTDEVGRQSFIKNNKMQTPTVSVAPSLKESWRHLKLK